MHIFFQIRNFSLFELGNYFCWLTPTAIIGQKLTTEARLLSYETCLDTKPVLYKDRFCSLTYVDPALTTRMQTTQFTHLPLDKMADILANDIFKCVFLYENDKIPILISLKLVPRRPIDNKPALV